MLIGKRIKFEELKDGMDVVVMIRDYYDGKFSGEVIRGRVIQENQGYHKGCLTVAIPTPTLVYDTDNFWLVTEKNEYCECQYIHDEDFACPCGYPGG